MHFRTIVSRPDFDTQTNNNWERFCCLFTYRFQSSPTTTVFLIIIVLLSMWEPQVRQSGWIERIFMAATHAVDWNQTKIFDQYLIMYIPFEDLRVFD